MQLLPPQEIAVSEFGDASEHIQRALDNAPPHSEFLINSSYRLAKPLSIRKPIKLRNGEGVTIRVEGNSYIDVDTDVSGSVFSGGNLDFSSGQAGGVGFGFYASNSGLVELANVTFLNVRNVGVLLSHASNVRIRDSRFINENGRQSNSGVSIIASSDCDISSNDFLCQGTAIRVGSKNDVLTDPVASNNRFVGNRIYGGWASQPYMLAGEGVNVKYTAAELIDESRVFDAADLIDFSDSLNFQGRSSIVRTLSIAGKCSIHESTNSGIEISGLDLIASNVRPGDYIRTNELWAKIDEILSPSRAVLIGGWHPLNIDTWLKAIPPPTREAASIFKASFGRILRKSKTSLVVESWMRIDGSKFVPPPGSRYEIIHPLMLSGFGVHNAANTIESIISNNRIHETRVEGIFASGRRSIVTGNFSSYGLDMGITSSVTGSSGAAAYNLIYANQVRHHAAAGIASESDGDTIEGNIILGGGYRSSLDDSFRTGIGVLASYCTIANNKTFGIPFSSSMLTCVHLKSEAKGNSVSGNTGVGLRRGSIFESIPGTNSIIR